VGTPSFERLPPPRPFLDSQPGAGKRYFFSLSSRQSLFPLRRSFGLKEVIPCEERGPDSPPIPLGFCFFLRSKKLGCLLKEKTPRRGIPFSPPLCSCLKLPLSAWKINTSLHVGRKDFSLPFFGFLTSIDVVPFLLFFLRDIPPSKLVRGCRLK